MTRAVHETLIAEFVGTAGLLIAVVGSGIAAERLCGGNVGLALLANALATGGALFVLILTFGPVSGAHMNPVVTFAAALIGSFSWKSVPGYLVAQVCGAVVGVWIAHAMFGLPLLETSTHLRTGPGQWLGEVVATTGLLTVIWGCLRYGTPVAAGAVAAYITGAYWFTSSTSFANPAVTLARSLSESFAGIAPENVAGFVVAQIAGLLVAIPLLRTLQARDA